MLRNESFCWDIIYIYWASQISGPTRPATLHAPSTHHTSEPLKLLCVASISIDRGPTALVAPPRVYHCPGRSKPSWEVTSLIGHAAARGVTHRARGIASAAHAAVHAPGARGRAETQRPRARMHIPPMGVFGVVATPGRPLSPLPAARASPVAARRGGSLVTPPSVHPPAPPKRARSTWEAPHRWRRRPARSRGGW